MLQPAAPEQPLPLQRTNVDPPAAVAVMVRTVPAGKLWEHALPPFPQLIPAGEEEMFPPPETDAVIVYPALAPVHAPQPASVVLRADSPPQAVGQLFLAALKSSLQPLSCTDFLSEQSAE